MSEKRLYSFREIAGELNLNYKKVLNFRNQVARFLPGLHDGKNFKCFHAAIEIISLVDALREEGYTFMMIRDILERKQVITHDKELSQWVDECIEKYGHHWMDVDGSACASISQYEPVCASMDVDVPVCASMSQDMPACPSVNQNGLVWINPNQFKPECAGMDVDIPVCASMCQYEPDYTSMDLVEPVSLDLDWNGSGQFTVEMGDPLNNSRGGDQMHHPGSVQDDKIKPVMRTELEGISRAVLEKHLSYIAESLSRTLTHTLQKMATENNIAITAICEAIEDIQQGIESVESRLSGLESELGVESADMDDMYRIDPGDLQVSLPELEFELDLPEDIEESENTEEDLDDDLHNLAAVRDSIYNGKPSKEALMEWILERRRSVDPSPSYRKLATILNNAKILTLSGRGNWTGSTVRNIVARIEVDSNDESQ